MDAEWTQRYFDRVYLRRWPLGLPTEAIYRHVDFLLAQLSVRPGDTLLDVGCGQGRYGLAFAKRGLRVTGLDASATLLREAQRLGREMGVSAEWIRGDMRSLPPGRIYASAILLDAFGYFDTNQENEGVVRQVATVLRPGGRLAAAVVNGARILAGFKASDREEQPERVITLRRQLDAGRRTVLEEVTVEERGHREVAERRQRLYSKEELVDIASRTGFLTRAVYGDLSGSSFNDAESSKIVLICERMENAPPRA